MPTPGTIQYPGSNPLRKALATALKRAKAETVEIVRSLVDSMMTTPKDGGLEIHLTGDLAGIFRLASDDPQTKKPPFGGGFNAAHIKLVAGACNHRDRHSLSVVI